MCHAVYVYKRIEQTVKIEKEKERDREIEMRLKARRSKCTCQGTIGDHVYLVYCKNLSTQITVTKSKKNNINQQICFMSL